MPPVGFKPAIPASEWPQTHAIGRAATGIGLDIIGCKNNISLGVRTTYQSQNNMRTVDYSSDDDASHRVISYWWQWEQDLQRQHTYCTVQSASWAADWLVATQEIHRISRNPKVHYRTHNRPPPVSILGRPNPVHIPTSHLLEIIPNIIHPSTPRSPHWSPYLRFPHLDPIHPPLLTHTRHMPNPSHSSWFYHPHDIGWGVQII